MADALEKRKQYPARIFYRATVVCPSCLQRFRETADACQRCGFDAYRVVQQFPYTAPVLERVIDNAGVMDASWRPELDRAVDRLSTRFPQVGFYFCTVMLDDPVKLPEFGFWMMNACRLEQGQQELDRAWSILLLLDVKRGLVSITPGYAIEAFIEDSAWEDALRQISQPLIESNYQKAFLDFMRHAERLLVQAGKQAFRKMKKA